MGHPERFLSKRVLYCGDGRLAGAASYLAGVLTRAGIRFDHVGSAEPFPDDALDGTFGAVILSDYPACNFPAGRLDALGDGVREGLGLLVLGGWESFVGRGAAYHHTPLAELLPVRMRPPDDRINTWRPCVVAPAEAPHPITFGLPLGADLPCVAGFNAFEAAPGVEVLLRVATFRADPSPTGIAFAPLETHPLLVVAERGRGRVACWASDVAPHWAGGLVDWGETRVAAAAKGANPVEIGAAYASLFERMVRWVRRELGSRDE